MSLSKNDLAKATSVLTLAANQNLGRLKSRGIRTPASTYIKKHGGKFKSLNQLQQMTLEEVREEFQRAKGFLEAKTSTVSGFKSWEMSMSNTLFEHTGIDYNSLTEREKRKFWEAYSKLEELDQANVYGARYRTSINEIYTAVKGGLRFIDIDDFVEKMDAKIYREDTAHTFDESESPFSLIENNPFKDEE